MDKPEEILRLLGELSNDQRELLALLKQWKGTDNERYEQWQNEQRAIHEKWKKDNDRQNAEWKKDNDRQNAEWRQTNDEAAAKWDRASEMRAAKGCVSMLFIFGFGLCFGVAGTWLVFVVSK